MDQMATNNDEILAKRADFRNAKYNCEFSAAALNRASEGIAYLRGVSGRPSNGPGPGNCGRVSCGYNAGIWWCNDVGTLFTLLPNATVLTHLEHVRAYAGFIPRYRGWR